MDDLLVYKYRPSNLNEYKQIDYNILKNMINNNLLNLIFYGLNGSGKKSILYTFLNKKYGNFTTNYESKIFKINSKEIIFSYFYSNYHIELNVEDMKSYSKIILSTLIKELAYTKNVINNDYRIIVLHNAEKLDLISQNMLRRILEKYYKNCRFILLTNEINKIISALKSRCLLINIRNFNIFEIKNITDNIIIKEQSSITYNPNSRNLKYNLFNLENKINNYDFNFKTYENELKEICMLIINKNISKKLYQNIENFLYNILVKNIDFKEIYLYILNFIYPKIDNKFKLIELVSECDEKNLNSLRNFFHIQYFFNKLIQII